MTAERENPTVSEVGAFFDRPGEEVAGEFSAGWVRHPNRREVFDGQGSVLALETPLRVRFFRVDSVIYYDDEYTKNRWPKSRGPEIASLEPGEAIGYAFHQSVLTFIKVGGIGSSSNIQLSNLKEIDRNGEPLMGRDSEIGPAKVAQLLDLGHQMRAQLAIFNLRDTRAFLLSVGGRHLTPDEIRSLEEEILGLE